MLAVAYRSNCSHLGSLLYRQLPIVHPLTQLAVRQFAPVGFSSVRSIDLSKNMVYSPTVSGAAMRHFCSLNSVYPSQNRVLSYLKEHHSTRNLYSSDPTIILEIAKFCGNSNKKIGEIEFMVNLLLQDSSQKLDLSSEAVTVHTARVIKALQDCANGMPLS